jgi:replication factor C subunit 2/4
MGGGSANNDDRSSMPWVEKYRPDRIEDVAQQEEVCAALKNSLETGELPNLMFYGPPGTGKTTVALALMKQFFGKGWKDRVKELNASDDRGIQAVRDKVKTFAQLSIGTLGTADLAASKARFKVIILDEADSMTHDAQASLRRIMEEFVHVTRFIIICNYVSKIIEPLHSRCSKFRFQPVSGEFQRQRLLHISECEKVRLGVGAMDKLMALSKGDMRCAVTMLQTSSMFYKEVTEDSLLEVACAVPDRVVDNLVTRTRAANSTDEVVRLVKEFLLDGYSGQQVMERLLDILCADANLPDQCKAKAAALFSQADERLNQGCDEELQLQHLLSQLRPLLQQAR